VRIAIFTESLPPLTDGVARTFTRLAECLDAEGVDFRIYAPVAPLAAASSPWRSRVRQLPSFAIPMYDYYRCAWPHFQGLDQELESFQPDLLHVTTPTFLGYYGLRWARRHRRPVVASYHTHFVQYFPYYHASGLMPLGWGLLRHFHNRCARTYAPSVSAMAELAGRGFQRLALWPRGVDTQAFNPRHRDLALRQRLGAKGEKLILFVGRLVSEKGLKDLVQVVRRLQAKGQKVRAVFAGDGPMARALRRRLPQAQMLGFVTGRPLAQLYASCDLFLFPSRTETFGNVVLEAMASGLPVVAYQAGGGGDILRESGAGLACAPGDKEGLVWACAELLANPGRAHQLARLGLQAAAKRSWVAINGALIQDYRELSLPRAA
jgi:glycosyltransferase involved in cell wall biosynthesis